MIKEPRQWSQPIIYHLYANTENFVAIDPMVIETSKNTYELNPEQRGCYFDVSVEQVITIRHDCFFLYMTARASCQLSVLAVSLALQPRQLYSCMFAAVLVRELQVHNAALFASFGYVFDR